MIPPDRVFYLPVDILIFAARAGPCSLRASLNRT